MRLVILLALLWAAPEQTATMRYGSSCLHVTERTWAEAPMVDGEPDYHHMIVHDLVIDQACGVIEVRRVK